MAETRNMAIPRGGAEPKQEPVEVVEGAVEETVEEQPKAEIKDAPITQEESEYVEKVFFEEDESVRLRDGVTYKIPPLGLRDAKNLMKKLNSIDTGVIIANLIADEVGDDNYDELLSVLLMAFKPYYKDMTLDYLAEYVDISSAKEVIDIMIGLNGIKKSL